jgi:hypothetical protein
VKVAADDPSKADVAFCIVTFMRVVPTALQTVSIGKPPSFIADRTSA